MATAPTASATLTSTGSLSAPKTGDVLTYTVAVTGDQGSISPGSVTVAGVAVAVTGGPWTFQLPETISGPVLNGVTLTFVQQADPHVYKATV